MKMRIAMRKLILLMVLAIVSSGAMADWAEMGENDTFVLYADFTTIRRVANRVKMWALYDFKQVQYISGEPFLSMKSQNQYDCIEENVQSIYSSFHFIERADCAPYEALSKLEAKINAPKRKRGRPPKC